MAKTFSFPRRMRLSGHEQFNCVYAARNRVQCGPLIVYGRPNNLGFSRLGLSVPARVGTAVERNTIKRKVREAFRLLQHELNSAYDVIVQVRPAKIETDFDYIQRLKSSIHELHQKWLANHDTLHRPTKIE